MNQDLNNIKTTGFKTPKDYFNTLEDDILTNIKTDAALKGVEHPGFKTPIGYLDSIEDSVFNKLPKKKSTKVVSLINKQHLIYISGIAAAILIMFGIFKTFKGLYDMEMDYEFVESYLLSQNISSSEIASFLTEEELLSINLEIMDEAFNGEGMEDYLFEHVNFEDLIEQ